MMDAYERQQVKELAARMTPALMQRILEAPISKASQEQAAAIILECCAEAMMEGDPITRLEAYDLHQRIVRWVWNSYCERQWQGTQVREVK